MEILKALLPLIESGLKLYMSGKLIEKSAVKAKDMAIRSGILIFGFVSFLVFFVASTLMVFIDLGNQLETHDGVHFSGMMLSGMYLTTLGLLVLAVCYGITKIMEKREQEKKPVAPVNPYAPLILFGEEFLKNLVQNLSEKEKHPQHQQQQSE